MVGPQLTWTSSACCVAFSGSVGAASVNVGVVAPDADELARRQDVGPREVVPDLERAVARDVEAEARLARTLLDHEEPAGVVGCLRRLALGLLGGQVEAEEGDVGVDARLVERRSRLRGRGRGRIGESTSARSWRLVDRAVGVRCQRARWA